MFITLNKLRVSKMKNSSNARTNNFFTQYKKNFIVTLEKIGEKRYKRRFKKITKKK